MKLLCRFALIAGGLAYARGGPPDAIPAGAPSRAPRFYGPIACDAGKPPVTLAFDPMPKESDGVYMAMALGLSSNLSVSLSVSLPGNELAPGEVCFGPAKDDGSAFRAYVEIRGAPFVPGNDSPVLVRILESGKQKVILIEPVPGG
jgi:hypothetical protein